jgi:hypothetical protein
MSLYWINCYSVGGNAYLLEAAPKYNSLEFNTHHRRYLKPCRKCESGVGYLPILETKERANFRKRRRFHTDCNAVEEKGMREWIAL